MPAVGSDGAVWAQTPTLQTHLPLWTPLQAVNTPAQLVEIAGYCHFQRGNRAEKRFPEDTGKYDHRGTCCHSPKPIGNGN